MKYENFERVNKLMKQINKLKELISDLSLSNISVNISTGQYSFMSIGTWSECDHPCSSLAVDFVRQIKEYYEANLEILYKELESL